MQQGEIAITSETDRVYLDTGDALGLNDPVCPAPLRLESFTDQVSTRRSA